MKLEWLEWDRIEHVVQRLPELARRLTLWERLEGKERMVAQQHLDDASLRAWLERRDKDGELEREVAVPQHAAAHAPDAPRVPGTRRSRPRADRAAPIEPKTRTHAARRATGRRASQRVETPVHWRVRAITDWIQACALRCVREDTELARFRLRVHGAGSKPIASACFSICNLTWIPADDDLPAHKRSSPSTDAPAASLPGAATSHGAPPEQHIVGYALPPELAPNEAYTALGQYYAQTGQLWLDGYRNILAVHTTLLQDTLDRLMRSRDLEDTLRAETVRLHLEHLQRTLSRELEPGDAATRDALVLQALAALQEVTRAAHASQLEAARLAEVRALLDAAPGVLALLQDPSIHALLRDPGHVPLLADVLRSVAAQLSGRETGS